MTTTATGTTTFLTFGLSTFSGTFTPPTPTCTPPAADRTNIFNGFDVWVPRTLEYYKSQIPSTLPSSLEASGKICGHCSIFGGTVSMECAKHHISMLIDPKGPATLLSGYHWIFTNFVLYQQSWLAYVMSISTNAQILSCCESLRNESLCIWNHWPNFDQELWTLHCVRREHILPKQSIYLTSDRLRKGPVRVHRRTTCWNISDSSVF